MHGTPIVATWSEENEVGIYNLTQAIAELNKPVEDEVESSKKKKKKQPKK